MGKIVTVAVLSVVFLAIVGYDTYCKIKNGNRGEKQDDNNKE